MKCVKLVLIIFGILISITNLCSAAPPNPSGEFIFADFDDETGTNSPAAALTNLTMDGNGGGIYTDLYSSEGFLEENVSFTYSIAPDGILTLREEGETDIDHGIVSADGNMFTLAYTMGSPGIAFGIKKSSGMSNASLSGQYILCQYEDEVGQNDPSTELNLLTLDGNGHGTFQVLPSGENGSFTYSIAADGMLTITSEGESTMDHGIVSADGKTFTFAFTIGSSGFGVGIKKSTGMSNASLSGYYIMSQFEDDVAQNSPWAAISLLEFDGSGNGTAQDLYTLDNDLENASFTYSVAADGMLTLTAGGEQAQGIVSSDGNILTLVWASVGQSPSIIFAIKDPFYFENNGVAGMPLMLLDDD